MYKLSSANFCHSSHSKLREEFIVLRVFTAVSIANRNRRLTQSIEGPRTTFNFAQSPSILGQYGSIWYVRSRSHSRRRYSMQTQLLRDCSQPVTRHRSRPGRKSHKSGFIHHKTVLGVHSSFRLQSMESMVSAVTAGVFLCIKSN